MYPPLLSFMLAFCNRLSPVIVEKSLRNPTPLGIIIIFMLTFPVKGYYYGKVLE